MLQRGPVRDRNVVDEFELVENGNGGVVDSDKVPLRRVDELASVAIGDNNTSQPRTTATEATTTTRLSIRDQKALALLVALYLLQGIPVGLAFGSIPFLLRAKLSYSQIGIFTLCTYPYSLKLLWSPIVDSCFSPKLGRRKSWIVPIQSIVGLLFWWLGNNVQSMIEVASFTSSILLSFFF